MHAPTKAESAHCTTSARSSKYAQSQKLSSLTSQKYRIFPQELQHLPRASPPNNVFIQCLGRPQREQAPPQNAALTRRALEEWERTLCENKAVAILEKLQEGRPALFQKDGGAMLIAIVLDRPLQEAQDLVDQPLQFLQEIKRVLDDQKSHRYWKRMLRTIQGDAIKQEATAKDACTTPVT